MTISLEVELSQEETDRLHQLAEASGKSPGTLVSEMIRSLISRRNEQIHRLSNEIMDEKAELYRRLAQ
jgi:predicted transcriptional regulator